MSKDEFDKLIEKYLSGNATPEEERLIDEFFQQQEKIPTLKHYSVSDEMWAVIEKSLHGGSSLKVLKPRSPHTKPGRRGLYRLFVPLAFAASITFAVVAFLITRDDPSVQASTNWVTSKIPNGQKSIITLPDGSRVHLNSSSSISYPASFREHKREIILRGEAFFEVMRDENRPFVVHSGKITTVVLGTSFNVNAYKNDNVKVAVATGKVQVRLENKEDANANRVILNPDEQVSYSPGNETLAVTKVDINKITAWKNHTLYFDGATLEEVAEQLERWYNVSIEFDNDKLRKCKVNGQYKDQSIHGVLGSIRYMHEVDYAFEEQAKIKLYGKGCSK